MGEELVVLRDCQRLSSLRAPALIQDGLTAKQQQRLDLVGGLQNEGQEECRPAARLEDFPVSAAVATLHVLLRLLLLVSRNVNA